MKILFILTLCCCALIGSSQSTITVSTNFSQLDADTYSWPITISGGSAGNSTAVILNGDILLTDEEQYFIVGSDFVGLEGAGSTITLQGISEYPGLVRNGTRGGNGFNFVSVNDINVHSIGSDLAGNAGWIGQQAFGYGTVNVMISNCSSDGTINGYNGGIAGAYSDCAINRCYSTGTIGIYSGGIFGAYSGGIATNCFSTGDMPDNYAGGIYGFFSTGYANDCYSTGLISGYGGGIFGYGNSGSATRCYSTGQIMYGGGGIAGQNFTGQIANSYSTGLIAEQAGGITGAGSTGPVSFCYTTGALGDVSSGGIVGEGSSSVITNSYAEVGNGWNDTRAATSLQGVNAGTWTIISSGIPVMLSSFNRPIYYPAAENTAPAADLYSPAGAFTGTYLTTSINGNNPAAFPGITTNATTGIIHFENTGIGSFVVEIYYTNINGSYEISTYTLNALGTLPVTWRSFTVQPKDNGAFLQWSTASENNSSHFTMQYSTTGRTWTNIGTVAAAGNASIISYYNFQHGSPVSGTNYYRLQQTDLDGKVHYSSIQQLKVKSIAKDFIVLNTIANNQLNVQAYVPVILSLYTQDGKLLWQKKLGSAVHHIETGNLTNGIYYLKGAGSATKILVNH